MIGERQEAMRCNVEMAAKPQVGFSRIACEARPARRAGLIVRLPLFRPEWADEGRPIDGLWISQTDSYIA